jgi:hypothetical protein
MNVTAENCDVVVSEVKMAVANVKTKGWFAPPIGNANGWVAHQQPRSFRMGALASSSLKSEKEMALK